jgi:hypothetical protein
MASKPPGDFSKAIEPDRRSVVGPQVLGAPFGPDIDDDAGHFAFDSSGIPESDPHGFTSDRERFQLVVDVTG